MATYFWSTLVNGQVVDPFNPASDVLRFDVAALSAAGITIDGVSVPGSTRFSDGSKTVTVHVALFAITTTNVTFLNGSVLIVGDNSTGTAGDNLPHTLTGGSGDDQLIGGSGTDTLHGGAGADRMAGGGGDDTYHVDSSAHVIVEAPSAGRDVVISSIDYVLDANLEDLRLVAGTAPLNGGGNASNNSIDGNDGNNTLTGGAGNDSINGYAGDDTLRGEAGDDTLIGGLGADVLDGGAGQDTVHYNRFGSTGVVVNLANPSQNTGEAAGDTYIGIERVVGSLGSDTITGNSGANRIYGLQGNNVLYGGAGDDLLEAMDGNDVLHGGPGADVLRGGGNYQGDPLLDYASYSTATAGVLADLLNSWINTGDAAGDSYSLIGSVIGSNFDDALYGTGGRNDIAARDGNDYLDGRAGDDNLQGGNGSDTLLGGDGADILAGDAGADSLNGGAGVDFARYDKATAALTASLAQPSRNTGDAFGDSYVSIEGLIGSRFNDTLYGDEGANQFRADPSETGPGGNDLMFGNGGNDFFSGYAGSDTAYGGAGDDFMNGGTGVDFFEGGEGADGFYGGVDPELDYMRYNNAATGLTVDLEAPSANTGEAAGDYYQGVEGLVGSRFDDHLYGDNDRNDLVGMDGNDILEGRTNFDNLQGGNGNDTLLGGDGNDILAGGAGADVLNGGNGFDFARYDKTAEGVTAHLVAPSQNTGEAVGDMYLSIEGLIGSAFGDTLTGDANANELRGMDGDDTLDGAGGNDTLIGGVGADAMDGGTGNDEFILRRGEAQGDAIAEFTRGFDHLRFEGFGKAAQGATFTQIDATHWSINSSDGAAHEIITISSGMVGPSDYQFI